jgi:hypothetical protein
MLVIKIITIITKIKVIRLEVMLMIIIIQLNSLFI